MAEDLLEGATRVLATRGAEGFTTNHVAKATGASIGSLYQYYPNKAALLAALHDRETQMLWAEILAILADDARSARKRLIESVLLTFHAQHQAAALQHALEGVDVDVPDTPGFSAFEPVAIARLARFLEEMLSLSTSESEDRAQHVFFVLSTLLARIPQMSMSEQELSRLALNTAEMLADFVGFSQ